MTKITRLLASLVVALATGILGASAADIQPVGDRIGDDKAGNPVYQVPANGIRIGYKLIGSGEPLIMIVGLGNDMERWPQEILEALSRKYQLILMDNRGMGFTTVNDDTFTYELFAGDVIGLLDALGVEKTNVLGFSMGSTITQELLLKYPQRFDKAIIYATSTDGSHVADALKGRTPDNPIVARQIEATTHWKTPLDQAALIPNQVMFMVGTADPVVGVDSSKLLAATVPSAWLVQFRNGTHGVMNELPVAFANIVLTFLENDETVTAK